MLFFQWLKIQREGVFIKWDTNIFYCSSIVDLALNITVGTDSI